MARARTTRPDVLRRTAITGNGFVATTAVVGAIEMFTGWPRRLPDDWLDGTPFPSYAVPGLLLGGLVGGSASVATWASARRSAHWPRLAMAAGAVLVGWTGAEVALLNQPEAPTGVEWFYAGLGLVNASIGALAARRPSELPSLRHADRTVSHRVAG